MAPRLLLLCFLPALWQLVDVLFPTLPALALWGLRGRTKLPLRSSRVVLELLGGGMSVAFVGSGAVARLWFHVLCRLVPIDDRYR